MISSSQAMTLEKPSPYVSSVHQEVDLGPFLPSWSTQEQGSLSQSSCQLRDATAAAFLKRLILKSGTDDAEVTRQQGAASGTAGFKKGNSSAVLL